MTDTGCGRMYKLNQVEITDEIILHEKGIVLQGMSLALGLHWDFITQLWRIKHWGRKGLGPDWRPGTRLEAWDQAGGQGVHTLQSLASIVPLLTHFPSRNS